MEIVVNICRVDAYQQESHEKRHPDQYQSHSDKSTLKFYSKTVINYILMVKYANNNRSYIPFERVLGKPILLVQTIVARNMIPPQIPVPVSSQLKDDVPANDTTLTYKYITYVDLSIVVLII